MANSRWILKEEFTGEYANTLEEHFVKINCAGEPHLVASIHRVDDILTILCKGAMSNSLWIGCPTCAEQFIQLLRVRLIRDDPALEPTIASSTKLRLNDKLRENMALAKRTLYDGDFGNGATNEQAQTVLDFVATMKWRSRSAAIAWDAFVCYARSDDIADV